MVDMDQQTPPPDGTGTSSSAPPPAGRGDGPRVTGEQMRDLDRLRRSSTDRYVAGVAGGLGRHLDIDPTIIRVLLAVLTFFGGAGLLVYGALWLFVPADDEPRAPVEVGTDVRRVVLVVVGVIALLIVFGTPFLGDGWGLGLPVPLILVGLVVLAVIATRNQRSEGATMTAAGSSTTHGTTPLTGAPVDESPGSPPAWTPPPTPSYPPPPPPRPRRTGLVLFWPTLALILIGLGTLGVFDTGYNVPASAYAALALAITGAMLVLGAFRERPGGLIALGLVAAVNLLILSVVGATAGSVSSEDVRFAPLTPAAVLDSYDSSTGRVELDLRRVAPLDGLDGRSISVELNAGEIFVIVPQGIDVDVSARVRYAGAIILNGQETGGIDNVVRETTLDGTPGTDGPSLDLDLYTHVGQITVDQR